MSSLVNRLQKPGTWNCLVHVGVQTALSIWCTFKEVRPTLEVPRGRSAKGSVLTGSFSWILACATAVSLLLSALPTIFFGSLQMPLRTKVVMCVLTGLGILYEILSNRDEALD